MSDPNTEASYGHKNPQLVKAFEASLEPLQTAFDDLNVVRRQTDIDIQSSAGTSVVRDVISTTNSGNVPQSQSTGEILVESGTTSGSTASIETAAFGQDVGYQVARNRPATLLAEGLGSTATVDASLIMREEW
jgi:hypothetical protein